MKKLTLLCAILFWAQFSTAQESKYAKDVDSVDHIIAALYDVISGPAGQERDWDRMRYIFGENGRLSPVRINQDGSKQSLLWTPDDYIDKSGDWLVQNGFFEIEISRKTEQYGSLVHVFSTYEARKTKNGEPFMRGINSIQLYKDGMRWKIINITWLGETSDNPIPAKYLK